MRLVSLLYRRTLQTTNKKITNSFMEFVKDIHHSYKKIRIVN